MSDDAFDGQVVLVTGASSGIGAATVRRFAERGADLVLAARSKAALESVAEDCRAAGLEAVVAPTDVTDPEAVEALVATTTERFGRLDVVVANAGIGEARDVPIPELPLEQFEQVTATNVHGSFYTTRAALPALRESGGTLVFLGSYKGRYPSTSTPVYAASKWWLRGFAASIAGRVGPDGVAVTVVNPSGVTTPFGSEFRETDNETALDDDGTLDATDVAEAITYAADQEPPTSVTEIDLNRRDILSQF